jgi:cytidylate kinase
VSRLIVITGPPGTGKSTVAALVADHFTPSALVAGDDFFGFLRTGGVAPWLCEAHDQNTAVIEAAAAASGRLARHCDVIYDGVIGPWFSFDLPRANRPHPAALRGAAPTTRSLP